jgi:lysozyme family protein
MADNFQTALKFVLDEEGGYTNDPHDPGGETNFGIIQSEYNEYRTEKGFAKQSVKYIRKEEYEDIYLKQYWLKDKCDVLPGGIDIVVFDSAVNCGVGTSIKFLQRALGVDDDGKLGPITLDKLSKTKNLNVLITKILDYRMKYYRALNGFKYYGVGWSNRVNRLGKLAPTLIDKKA